jgi:hypothetical protein
VVKAGCSKKRNKTRNRYRFNREYKRKDTAMLNMDSNQPNHETRPFGIDRGPAKKLSIELCPPDQVEEMGETSFQSSGTLGNTALAMDPEHCPAVGIAEMIGRYIERREGLFVEIGAGDGESRSITALFEQMGWTGLLIESEIESCARCMANRPKCGVLN